MGPLMGHRGAEPVGRLRSARVSSAGRDRALQVRDLEAAGLSGVRCVLRPSVADPRHRNPPICRGIPLESYLMGKHADQPARSEATIEPRLVMKGDDDKPFIQGEFFVAAYQRGYRWGRDEVRQLLKDIKTHKREAGRGEPTDYYLQPIVVLKRDGGSWELVDGQQRLTTLFLITKYVATKIADSKLDYLLTYETRQGSRDFLETLDFSRRDENIDYYHIAQAYDVIGEWFDEQPNATQAAIDLHTALANWVYVIWYEAPPGTDATALFTRLNRDRIPLTDSELIKALVLSNSGAAGGKPGRQQEIAAQWDGFERDLRDPQFWAFLTRSSTERSTHIDFLFESMTPKAGLRERPRYWTFSKVQEDIAKRGNGRLLARRRRAPRTADRVVPRPRSLPPDRLPHPDR